MDLARPAGQHEGRGVELGDDRGAGEAVAGAERRAVVERHLASRPTPDATGKRSPGVAPCPRASIGRGGRGHAAGRLDAQGHQLDRRLEREAVEALMRGGEGGLDGRRVRRAHGTATSPPWP